MNQKHKQYIFHVIENVDLMVKNVIQIKSGVMINADVSVKIQKDIVYAKKIMCGILVHMFARLINI